MQQINFFIIITIIITHIIYNLIQCYSVGFEYLNRHWASTERFGHSRLLKEFVKPLKEIWKKKMIGEKMQNCVHLIIITTKFSYLNILEEKK